MLAFWGEAEGVHGNWQIIQGPLGQSGDDMGLFRVIWYQVGVIVAKGSVELRDQMGQWSSAGDQCRSDRVSVAYLGSVGLSGVQQGSLKASGVQWGSVGLIWVIKGWRGGGDILCQRTSVNLSRDHWGPVGLEFIGKCG